MKNALTIDLEDWYHPEFVRKRINGIKKEQIIDSTFRLLQLLEKTNTKATFFIIGEIAQKHPKLIKYIYDGGHELAFHGMKHVPVRSYDYNTFQKEIFIFNNLIKKTLNRRVEINGFRAPSFSINNKTNYILKCLIDNGFKYDSSIVPINLFYYGIRHARHHIYKPNLNKLHVNDSNSKLIEFPLTIFKFGRIKIPISGGFYLRIFPYFIYNKLLKNINQEGNPFVIYIHPWEIYPETYRVKNIGLFKYFITYFGINKTFEKVEKLLKDFKFMPMRNVLDKYF